MERFASKIDLLEEKIDKLIKVVTFGYNNTVKELSNNKTATMILEQKIERLLNLSDDIEDVQFKIITNQEEFEIFESEILKNKATYLSYFTKSSRRLDKFMSTEFLATLKLNDVKKTNFYREIFEPLCIKRILDPNAEIAAICRRAKNLRSKKKSLKKKQQAAPKQK